MKYFTEAILFLLVLFTLGCSVNKINIDNNQPKKYLPKEYLESVSSNPQIIPGTGLGKLLLGETRHEYLFNENINNSSYFDNGIYLKFRNNDTLIEIIILNKIVYKTVNGNMIDLTEKEILLELGEPESRKTILNKGDIVYDTLPTINYPGMRITFDPDNNRVIELFKEKLE